MDCDTRVWRRLQDASEIAAMMLGQRITRVIREDMAPNLKNESCYHTTWMMENGTEVRLVEFSQWGMTELTGDEHEVYWEGRP